MTCGEIMAYLATLHQLGSSETSNMWEEANVFYSKLISKQGFMTYFAILLRIEENKKKYQKTFVLLG
jgi:hypothetical protein